MSYDGGLAKAVEDLKKALWIFGNAICDAIEKTWLYRKCERYRKSSH